MIRIIKNEKDFDLLVNSLNEDSIIAFVPNKEGKIHSTNIASFKVSGKRVLKKNNYLEVLIEMKTNYYQGIKN